MDWLIWPNSVPGAVCDDLVSRYRPNIDATIGFNTNLKVDESYRKAKLAWVGDTYIRNLLYGYALEANKVWGFDLTELDNSVQLAKYEPGGKYDWHHDVDWKYDTHRKLSVVVQLSDPGDYTGGEFEFVGGFDSVDQNIFAPKGSVLVFPSYQEHRVNPLIEGTRYSLVTWVRGPKFK